MRDRSGRRFTAPTSDAVREARESLLRFWSLSEPWETVRQRIADDRDLMRVVACTSAENLAQDQTSRVLFAAMAYLAAKHRFALPRDSRWRSFAALRSSLLQHSTELRALLQRSAQVNDPLRCAALYPGLLFAASRARRPLALVEVGPSLGLNLCMDRFSYEYSGIRMGLAGSKFHVVADVDDLAARAQARRRRAFPFARRQPQIGLRVGLELNPVPLDDDSVAWMRAFHFPGGQRRFDAALKIRREVPVRILRGDASVTLPQVLADIPSEQVPLVFHSSVTYQMPQSVRARLMSRLAEAAATRRLLYMTWAEETARRGAPLQLTDFHLARRRVERHLLAFVNRWRPVPRIEWVHPGVGA